MDNNSRTIPVYEQADILLRFATEHYPPNTNIKAHLLRPKLELEASTIPQEHIQLLLNYLYDTDRIRWTSPSSTFMVTLQGYHHLETLHTASDTAQAFVAIWFDSSMDDAYENGIRPAIEGAGYAPLRIDKKEFFGKVDDEIIAEIRKSRFVVADFSHGGDGVRGSVYFEAGFAYGLGIPVIYLCHEGSTLAFDTNHYPHIMWNDTTELREQLQTKILALLGEGPNRPDSHAHFPVSEAS
jgi:hypothetical protein